MLMPTSVSRLSKKTPPKNILFYHVLSTGGPTEDPAGTSWSYEVQADADATMYLTANITTWHMQTLLNVHTSTSPAAGIRKALDTPFTRNPPPARLPYHLLALTLVPAPLP